MRLKIINTTSEKLTQGSEIWLEAKLIFKIRLNSVIRSLKPYQYLDEMVKGPFKRWTHLHRFYDINTNKHQKQSEVIDEVNFEIPYSYIGIPLRFHKDIIWYNCTGKYVADVFHKCVRCGRVAQCVWLKLYTDYYQCIPCVNEQNYCSSGPAKACCQG